MRRLLPPCLVALIALCAVASPALARTPRPVISSVTPAKVAVGGVLTLKGKNFASGVRNNRVFFVRASDGKSIRVRPRKASKTRIDVLVPSSLTALLADDGQGGKKETRFQLMIFTKVLGPKTRVSRSPLISPAGAVPGAPGTPPPPPDCDNDGTPDASDADDDNDGLSDDLENAIKTNVCAADTDGDNVSDAFEYYSSLDLNASPNYAGKRPYPNPLDASDASSDFDGDGLTQAEEFGAAKKFGTVTSAPLTYSDGNQQSVATGNSGAMDLDNNGRITDEEKDVDNDGLGNWLEIAKGEPDPISGSGCAFTPVTAPTPRISVNIFTICNGGPTMPNGNTFSGLASDGAIGNGAPPYNNNRLDYLDPDTDGDGIPDGVDDKDFDGTSNLEEITAGSDGYFSSPNDPCSPDPDSRSCPTHPAHV